MTKQIHILLALCLLNGTLTYGWFRLKAREQTLQRQIETFPPVRNELAKAEKHLQNCAFPWKDDQNFADTRATFEALFQNALQSNFVWLPDPKPFPHRENTVSYSGNATAFFFYPHVRPFLKALADCDAPLWIRSLQLTRNGLNNEGFRGSLAFDAAALSETASAVVTSPKPHLKHSPEATAAMSSHERLSNE